jgi:pyruvate/2-oxoglutarate dehydrogenase complex dihydrolipoamide acyltransferase (E2) component
MRKRARIILWSVGTAAAVPVAVGMVQGAQESLHSTPAAATASSAAPSRPAPATSTPAAPPPSSAPPKPAPSTQPPSPAPTVLVSDLPSWDQDGDPACRMHYSQTADGRTVTRFTITKPGELITHVSGPAGLQRHDEQVTANTWAYTYDTTLAQITDMGAVLHLPGGSQVACGISAGAMAP